MSSCPGQFQHVLDGKGTIYPRGGRRRNACFLKRFLLTLSISPFPTPSDLRKLLPPAVLTETFVQAVAKAYHSQHGKLVTVDGAKVSAEGCSGTRWVVSHSPPLTSPPSIIQVLLHKLGEVDDRGYLDPHSKHILVVDGMAGEVRFWWIEQKH